MSFLIIGVLFWSLIHFLPARRGGLRASLISGLGEKPYKGVFSLLTVAAILLMIYGWKSSPVVGIYTPPAWGGIAAFVLMLIGFILLFAPYRQTSIKRLLRHPQLTGIVLWGVGHLLVRGDTRSLVLFGGLSLWSIIEILLLNHRDGPWQKPEKGTMIEEVKLVLAGLGFFLIVAYTHGWIFGVSAIPE